VAGLGVQDSLDDKGKLVVEHADLA
jgi:hypothetical protein